MEVLPFLKKNLCNCIYHINELVNLKVILIIKTKVTR